MPLQQSKQDITGCWQWQRRGWLKKGFSRNNLNEISGTLSKHAKNTYIKFSFLSSHWYSCSPPDGPLVASKIPKADLPNPNTYRARQVMKWEKHAWIKTSRSGGTYNTSQRLKKESWLSITDRCHKGIKEKKRWFDFSRDVKNLFFYVISKHYYIT